jgi:hypothetical protein
MANILITVVKTTTPLPAGVTFGQTNLVVTDSANAVQTLAVNGSETPPWTITATGLADGSGTVVGSDVDTTGALIGTSVTQTFTTGTAGGTGTFAATTGITVTPA